MNYGCDYKFKYTSHKTAVKVSRHGKIKLNVYLCDNCHFWHIGNKMISKKS